MAASIQQEGLLRNPPLVWALGDPDRRYVVLDGANRVASSQALNLEYLVAQVIRRVHEDIKLETWTQVIVGCSPLELLHAVTAIPEIELSSSNGSGSSQRKPSCPNAIKLYLLNGQRWEIKTQSRSLYDRVSILQQFFGRLRQMSNIERSSTSSANQLFETYPDIVGWVELPPFQINEIRILAERGQLLPSGLTRFIVSPRILGLNYPLSILNHGSSLDEKQNLLLEWIRQLKQARRVRYYPEATIVFND